MYASSCYAEQAHALLEALARESRGVIMRWEQEGAAHRVRPGAGACGRAGASG